jgi:hypothetical protein
MLSTTGPDHEDLHRCEHYRSTEALRLTAWVRNDHDRA